MRRGYDPRLPALAAARLRRPGETLRHWREPARPGVSATYPPAWMLTANPELRDSLAYIVEQRDGSQTLHEYFADALETWVAA